MKKRGEVINDIKGHQEIDEVSKGKSEQSLRQGFEKDHPLRETMHWLIYSHFFFKDPEPNTVNFKYRI